MVFLDSSIVIYYVEQPATWGRKASDRLTALRASGEQFAVTELVHMECLVGPLKVGDAEMLADFAACFAAPDVVILPITAPIAERAAETRAYLSIRADGLFPPSRCGGFRLQSLFDKRYPIETVRRCRRRGSDLSRPTRSSCTAIPARFRASSIPISRPTRTRPPCAASSIRLPNQSRALHAAAVALARIRHGGFNV